MSDSMHREQLELQLKAELDEAEHFLRIASPQTSSEARRRFREALHKFAELVLDEQRSRPFVVSKSAP